MSQNKIGFIPVPKHTCFSPVYIGENIVVQQKNPLTCFFFPSEWVFPEGSTIGKKCVNTIVFQADCD